jgi:hypothetical protein
MIMISGRETHTIAAKLLHLVLLPQRRLSKHDLDSLQTLNVGSDGIDAQNVRASNPSPAIHDCEKCPGTMICLAGCGLIGIGISQTVVVIGRGGAGCRREKRRDRWEGISTSSQRGWQMMQEHNNRKMVRLACVACSRNHYDTMLGNRTETCNVSDDWRAVRPSAHPRAPSGQKCCKTWGQRWVG